MTQTTTTHDPVNAPKHYTSGASSIGRPALKVLGFTDYEFEFECLDALHWRDESLWILKDAFVFCVVRYLWRAGLKDNAVQDLEKAGVFVRLAIEDKARQRPLDLRMLLDNLRIAIDTLLLSEKGEL
jgi:hypothetical protein